MTQIFKYSQRVVIVTDDLSNATKVAKDMANIISVEVLNWHTILDVDFEKFDICVFDVNLAISANVARLKKLKEKNGKLTRTIFSVDRRSHALVAQANALGASIDVKRPLFSEQLINVIVNLCNDRKNTELDQSERFSSAVATKKAHETCLAISDLMDSFVLAIRKGGPLPFEEMQESGAHIIDVIDTVDMETWLRAVRSHSSYTYRHVMIVAGFATAFGSKFNLSYAEKERLTLGALVHDIGKIKIPQKILDKPSELTPEEAKKMRRHSAEGAIILGRDRRMSEEIISIARSHHEYLDGSGYPDGLKGDEIPDIVRLMTVIDIFSALVEARPYKKSMTVQEAYDVLVAMGDKLDQDIVRAFEPIALDQETHALVQRINGTAA